METKNTYKIPTQNISRVEHEIAKLNRRAARRGFEPVSIKVSEEEIVEKDKADRILGIYRNVVIDGVAPSYSGWCLVASIQKMPETGKNVVMAVPGQQVPEQFRGDTEFSCDHCQIARHRKYVFVVNNSETGEYKQVGRSCLGDFLSHNDPHRIAGNAQWLCAVEDAMKLLSCGSFGTDYIDLEFYLTNVVAVIEEKGWVSRGKAKNGYSVATADIALQNMAPAVTESQRKDRIETTDDHWVVARKALKWVREELASGDNESNNKNLSDYEYNLVTVCEGSYIKNKFSGIAASLISAFYRAKEREINRRKAAKISNHFGEVKKREEFVLTLVGTNAWENNFGGITVLYRFLDDNGDRATWFSSNGCSALKDGDDAMIDSRFKIKGTVKKHDEYNGIKQTVLTRCKVLEKMDENQRKKS